MGFKGLLFLGFFGACTLCALAEPFAGVMAYVVHYHTAPESSWWGRGLAVAGVRYSFTISLFLAVGTLLNLKRLPYGRLITSQEAIYLALLGWIVLSRVLTGKQTSEDAVDKMIKMSVFVLAMTHIVVTSRRYDQFMWLLISCAFYLGYEAFTAPASYYTNGRLNGGIGGPDFTDANALAAHVLALMPFIGVKFLLGNFRCKVFCFVAGSLAANTIVQTRSRGSFLAAAAGFVMALILAPKGQRKRLWPLMVLGVVGGLVLVDSGFMERMETLESGQRKEDGSAQSRLRTWKASLPLIQENLLGVGPGNFAARIGEYAPEFAGRDTHNTYIRCASELGIPGLLLFLGLIVNAFRTLSRICRVATNRADLGDLAWHAFALRMSLMMYLVACTFISSNYIEMMWWVLLLPTALERVTANAVDDSVVAAGLAHGPPPVFRTNHG